MPRSRRKSRTSAAAELTSACVGRFARSRARRRRIRKKAASSASRREHLMNKWTRRTLLATGGLVGGGLALGVAGLAFAPNRLTVRSGERGGMARLTTWVKIAADNTVTAIVPH